MGTFSRGRESEINQTVQCASCSELDSQANVSQTPLSRSPLFLCVKTHHPIECAFSYSVIRLSISRYASFFTVYVIQAELSQDTGYPTGSPNPSSFTVPNKDIAAREAPRPGRGETEGMIKWTCDPLSYEARLHSTVSRLMISTLYLFLLLL